MRESTEKRIYSLSIVLAYLLSYVFVLINPNIHKFNPVRFATLLAILISLLILWNFAEVVRIKQLVTTISILAVLGMAISGFMLYAHYNTAAALCPPTESGTVPCDIVNKSIYAEIFGIPVAIFGILGYLVVFCFSRLLSNRQVYSRRSHLIEKYEQRLEGMLTTLCVLALFFTLWLNYVQFIMLKTLCVGCELSAITIIMLLLVSFMIWRRKA